MYELELNFQPVSTASRRCEANEITRSCGAARRDAENWREGEIRCEAAGNYLPEHRIYRTSRYVLRLRAKHKQTLNNPRRDSAEETGEKGIVCQSQQQAVSLDKIESLVSKRIGLPDAAWGDATRVADVPNSARFQVSRISTKEAVEHE